MAGLFPAQSDPVEAPPPPTETVTAYQRRVRFASFDDSTAESELRFDPTVPVEGIAVPTPEVAGLTEANYEVIGEKIT